MTSKQQKATSNTRSISDTLTLIARFKRLFDEYEQTADDDKLDMRTFSMRLLYFIQTNKKNKEAMEKFNLLHSPDIAKAVSPRSVLSVTESCSQLANVMSWCDYIVSRVEHGDEVDEVDE